MLHKKSQQLAEYLEKNESIMHQSEEVAKKCKQSKAYQQYTKQTTLIKL
jgi:hypothetical protein